MPERIRKILDRIVEWWKKFNTKQRALLISIASVVLVSLIILAYVATRPTYVPLVTCESAKEASQVRDLLDSDGSITYQVSKDGLVFTVLDKDEANAILLLGANDISAAAYDINQVTSGSFSQTESDKAKLYKDFLEKKFSDHLKQLDGIEDATVDIDLPKDDGTILSKDEQGSAAVVLTLKDTMDSEQAYGIAQFIATEMGNDDTSKITIIDSKRNVLFSGADADSAVGMINSQLSYQQKQENLLKSEIRNALLESQMYSNVQVVPHLNVDYDTAETVEHLFFPPDGQTNGMIGSVSEYNSEAYGGSAQTPGTDANDDTTVLTRENANSYSVISQKDTKYQNNEKITTKKSAGGKVDYENSSISIVCTKYVVYDEEILEKSGELDNMTFEEYKAANSEPTQIDPPEDLYQMVSKATGFSQDAISIICYQQPEFVPKSSGGRSLSDILQIVLAVLIFAMLGYVVFRSTRKQKEEELEPELSVDGLLESTATAEEELENIGYTEKSETRLLIEKFVDENPEAAALLLRNWLNDEWD
ncbi:flagellar M-ring protein FliF C-terminal domain-containing protein [Agathobacter ruminis]|uniref:Flagellar biosynthesis protein n=1 Tax=Agathobacter ruminis TaxID=1712665 RepID=A0A2G3E3F9_9FIRM|nr:flagellar M-ring protein FliF C-terminal domain-containing protein [Agathobacter ruminis]MDC7302646.1 flagellar biosynthesis protein [Agathobacter ruminis]PHU37794.1 flagellar biosynthesis protein [Agathobacter ruminis]